MKQHTNKDGRMPWGNQKSGVKCILYTLPTADPDKSLGFLLIWTVKLHMWSTISQY